jgi:leader peptidase (prepilin peptidase)/N-methyltransferase
VALAFIDLDVRRLPDAIVLPSYPVMAVLLTAAAAAGGDWDDLLRAVLGGLILGGFYFALVFAYPAGMGFGDVKLSGVLGMALGYLGWAELGVGAFLGFLYGGLIGIVLLLVGRAGRKSAIPFGPFMLLGALTAVLVGGGIADAYTGLLV